MRHERAGEIDDDIVTFGVDRAVASGYQAVESDVLDFIHRLPACGERFELVQPIFVHAQAVAVGGLMDVGEVSDMGLARQLLAAPPVKGVEMNVVFFTLHVHRRRFSARYRQCWLTAADDGQRAVALRQMQQMPVGLQQLVALHALLTLLRQIGLSGLGEYVVQQRGHAGRLERREIRLALGTQADSAL